MANYPGAIDGAASLFTPVDAFSAKPLETTTTAQVNPGDSTISVATTTGGFAASYGVLSLDDELVVYTGKTATQFTGCQRGAFGTAAATHINGGTLAVDTDFALGASGSRITFDGKGGAKPAERWSLGHRIRDVEVAPDGAMWAIEDSRTGGLFRLTPKKP